MPRATTQTPADVPAATVRRLALQGAGLLDDPERPATPGRLHTLVQRLGFVQVDSIQAVERAHHLILAARLDGYRPALLDRLVERDRHLFEHWTHDAAIIPRQWLPYWRARFERSRGAIEDNKWWSDRLGPERDAVCAHVLERIRAEGPLQSKDFEHQRRGAGGSWWGWTPQKAALEYLWHTGTLAVTRRVQFQKVYDLMERVLPEASTAPVPSAEAVRDWACRAALERLGVATAAEMAAFWSAVPLAAARAWCDETARQGEIVPVRAGTTPGGGPRLAWAPRDWRARARRLREPPRRSRLLAPFDPLVWDRKRARVLFGFEYTFEAFVPAAKRRYGYYVLPILHGDRLVGRADPERTDGTLRLRRVWWEPDVRPSAERDRDLQAALERLAACIGLQAAPIRSSARRKRAP